MAALYVVAAWLVMQVGEVVIGLASLPDWVGKALLAILAIGFPIALILAWVYEVTPEGLKPESEVDRSKSVTTITGRRMDFIIIAVLTAALLVFAYDKWWQPETEAGPPAKSVAVLPFVNVTADEDKEYLSDGIAEELIGLLAAIPELTVMSRSSAFALKGQNIEVPEIGRRLNVAHILEGSVRSTGDRLKIHVQLIDSKADAHLWAETFEGAMDDVFAIQDEIASRVVDQLKVTLLGEKPRTTRTHPETYTLLLKARFFQQQSTIDSLREAEVLLRQALALDSEYVPAWIALSQVYLGLAMAETQSHDEIMDLAEHAAGKALELDPASGAAHTQKQRDITSKLLWQIRLMV
jgi:TolB-like protein